MMTISENASRSRRQITGARARCVDGICPFAKRRAAVSEDQVTKFAADRIVANETLWKRFERAVHCVSPTEPRRHLPATQRHGEISLCGQSPRARLSERPGPSIREMSTQENSPWHSGGLDGPDRVVAVECLTSSLCRSVAGCSSFRDLRASHAQEDAQPHARG